MDKQVILINGTGGSGKDTFVSACQESHAGIVNRTSIYPVRNILSELGIHFEIEKGNRMRRLMADLKDAFDRFDDRSFSYCLSCIDAFMQERGNEAANVLFIHVREPENMSRLQAYMKEKQISCKTLLVYRPACDRPYHNSADDSVFDFDYDLVFRNDCSDLESAKKNMVQFFEENII